MRLVMRLTHAQHPNPGTPIRLDDTAALWLVLLRDPHQGEHGRSQWQKLLIEVYRSQLPDRSGSFPEVHAIYELNHLVILQFF